MDEGKVYRAALTLWGADVQTLMVFEEMAELQKELCKHARGKDNRDAIAEEIADVEIMLEQMKILHGCVGLSAGYREKKLERLAERCGLEETSVSAPCIPPELADLRKVHINATPDKEKELRRMMREAGPGMIVNLKPDAEIGIGKPFNLEAVIRMTVAETFKVWTETAKAGGWIVLPVEDEEAPKNAHGAVAGT